MDSFFFNLKNSKGFHTRNTFSFFFLKKNKLMLKNSNIVFMQYFTDILKNFFENFLKKRIFLKIQNCSYFFFFIQEDVSLLYLKIKQYQHFFINKFNLKELAEVSLLTIFTKDIKYLHNWFVINAERCHFRDHKKFFQFFKIFLIRYFSYFFFKYNCLGLKVNIAGKISGAGGSKKKKFYVYWGSNSLVTKNGKFLISNGQIRTLSGVLGINFILLYT